MTESSPDVPGAVSGPMPDAASAGASVGGVRRVQRLTLAMEAFLTFRDRGPSADAESFLTQHKDLRDLLEPMLEEVQPVAHAGGTMDPASLQPGRQVGDYRIVREVGRGGMGIVFEAEQVSLRRRVALKLLHPHLALSATSIERFRHEAAAAGGLCHAAIVPIHEVGEWRGLHYFSMEFVEGQPLQHLLHGDSLGIAGQATRPRQVAELLAQVADALQHAHDGGLVHRDVKPHNIMVAKDGAVRLLDFGLVKNVSSDSQSGTGGYLGTPHYSSPEQASGVGELGPQTDVFSLGVVMYELLARRRPFDGETSRIILQRIESGDCEALRLREPRIPRDLETICHKALSVELGARYASAAAFAADLRRFLRTEPILARAPGVAARSWKWVRRHRMRVALWTAVAACLLTIPIGYALHEHDQARVVERERMVLDRAEDLAFASIEQTLSLLEEQLQGAPELAGQHRVSVDAVVKLCESFLQLRAQDPKRTVRAAKAMAVTCDVYMHLGQFTAGLAACERALSLLQALPVSVGTHGRFEALLLRRRIYLEHVLMPPVSDQQFGEQTAAWLAVASGAGDDQASLEHAQILLVRARALGDLPSRWATAEQLARRAITMLEALDAATMPNARIEVLRARSALGLVLLRSGRARESLRELQLVASKLSDLPTTAGLLVERVQTTAAIGEALQQVGERGAAEAALRAGIEVADQFRKDYPFDQSLRRAGMRTRTRLSAFLVGKGGAEAYREAEELVRQAKAADAALEADIWMDASLRGQIAMQLATCLLMRSRGEAREEAQDLLQQSCELFRSVLRQQPDRVEDLRALGGALSNLAGIANEELRFATAAAMAEEAIACQQQVLAAMPGATLPIAYLGMHYSQLALACANLDRHEEVVAATAAVIQYTPRNAAALRLAAQAATQSMHALMQSDTADEASTMMHAGRCADVAVRALTAIADFNKPEARKWLTSERFAELNGRADFDRLVQECR